MRQGRGKPKGAPCSNGERSKKFGLVLCVVAPRVCIHKFRRCSLDFTNNINSQLINVRELAVSVSLWTPVPSTAPMVFDTRRCAGRAAAQTEKRRDKRETDKGNGRECGQVEGMGNQ